MNNGTTSYLQRENKKSKSLTSSGAASWRQRTTSRVAISLPPCTSTEIRRKQADRMKLVSDNDPSIYFDCNFDMAIFLYGCFLSVLFLILNFHSRKNKIPPFTSNKRRIYRRRLGFGEWGERGRIPNSKIEFFPQFNQTPFPLRFQPIP
ncbi:hypothetical protein AABB24_010095 [Solanum stoloniferum]|uniref:Transmembrane protein n=1 Tax=Solanum stoloniferum TaxID=62892 RepID=A0ABD2UM53_9SOLN